MSDTKQELTAEQAAREATALRHKLDAGVLDLDSIKQVMERLDALANKFPNNPAILAAIQKVAEAAQTAQTQQTLETNTRAQVADRKLHAIDAKKEPLAASLDRLGLWTEEEKKRFEAYIPGEKYFVPEYKNGKPTGVMRELDGQAVRKALTITQAVEHMDRVSKDPEALREYNISISGNEKGPQTIEEAQEANKKVQEARSITQAVNDGNVTPQNKPVGKMREKKTENIKPALGLDENQRAADDATEQTNISPKEVALQEALSNAGFSTNGRLVAENIPNELRGQLTPDAAGVVSRGSRQIG